MPSRKRAASVVSSATHTRTEANEHEHERARPAVPSLTTLPVPTGDFTTSVTASLTRPFALFSLTRLGFRTSIAKPPRATLLEPLVRVYEAIGASVDHQTAGGDDRPVPDVKAVLKALEGLQTFAKEAKEYLTHRTSDKRSLGDTENPEDHIAFVPNEQDTKLLLNLLHAYAHGFSVSTSGLGLISSSANGGASSSSSLSKTAADLHACRLTCLAGLFFARSYAIACLDRPRDDLWAFSDLGTPSNLRTMRAESAKYLAASFLDHHQQLAPSGAYRVLCPMVSESKRLADRLAQSARQLTGSKSKPAQPTTVHLVREEEVLSTLELLDAYADHIAMSLQYAPHRAAPAEAGLKKRGRATKKAQPSISFWSTRGNESALWVRLRLEAMMLGTELAMGMTTGDMAAVKRRAHERLGRLTVDPKVGTEGAAAGSDGESDEDRPAGSRLVKTVNTARGESEESGEGEDEDIKWEDESERRLSRCLGEMVASVERFGGAQVLLDSIDAEAIFESSGPSALISGPKRGHKASQVGTANKDGAAPSESGESDDNDSHSEEEEEEEEEDDDTDGPACPLRTLFALHDRYEEQRLAVWLTLPTDRRGGMGAFMRGAEPSKAGEEGEAGREQARQGEVGEGWDGLGRALLGVMGR